MFFVLVALPILMFAMAWGIDATRVFIAQRQAARAAEAAAVAGAFQFKTNSVELNGAEARKAVEESVKEWEEFGALKMLSNLEIDEVTISPYNGRPQTVTVKLKYNIGGMLFAGFFAQRDGVDADVVRSATVCVPGDTAGVTQGFCKRPDVEG
jgi:hypothetical protein